MKVLVLGGTGEAHALCLELWEAGVDFLHSRAGILENPMPLPYPHRDGGFGGADGLAAFVSAGKFSHIVLATHPFAKQIAGNARRAAAMTGLPLREIQRAPWAQPPGAIWHPFDKLDELADALPRRARVFLTIGRKRLDVFSRRADLWFLYRAIEPSGVPLDGIEIIARPPFDLTGEIALMREYRIDCLVTRNSGGEATRAKIDAAAQLGVPVFLLQHEEIGEAVAPSDVRSVLDWLLKQVP